jgi:hypothetical protein
VSGRREVVGRLLGDLRAQVERSIVEWSGGDSSKEWSGGDSSKEVFKGARLLK